MGLSSPPAPPALGMHEIEQNGSTHPYINYSPYAPPRWAHSICKKDIFRSILRFDVTFVCCCLFYKREKSFCYWRGFESTLKYFQWVKVWGKVYFSLLLFSFYCVRLCDNGREELSLSCFLLISANTEQVQQAATKIHFITISMSCLYSLPGPHLPCDAYYQQ